MSMESPMKKALLVLLRIFLAMIIVIAAIAFAVSSLFGTSIIGTLEMFILLGGLILMVFSGLVGAGFGERTLHRSDLYVMTGSYRNAVTRERPQRRDEEFQFMVVGFLLGLGLVGLSLLIGVVPLD
jgi:hypothetical protein